MQEQLDRPSEARIPLSRERVLRAAMAIADARGLDGLTMRGLAQDLGVEAMSLYHWVAGKDDLIDGLLDLVEREVELPSPQTEWKVAIRQLAGSAHDALLRHPWAAGRSPSAPRPGPAQLLRMEATLEAL